MRGHLLHRGSGLSWGVTAWNGAMGRTGVQHPDDVWMLFPSGGEGSPRRGSSIAAIYSQPSRGGPHHDQCPTSQLVPGGQVWLLSLPWDQGNPSQQSSNCAWKPILTAHQIMSFFLVAINQFQRGHQFVDDEEHIEYISGHFDGRPAQWYVNLYELGAPKLRSLPLFVRAFDPNLGILPSWKMPTPISINLVRD